MLRVNERFLPAIVQPVVTVLERPFAGRRRFKAIWTDVLMVNHQSTPKCLKPVMDLVDNQDLALIESPNYGFSEVILSLIDVWDGKGPFPSLTEIDAIISEINKKPAGIAEMARFAEMINRRPIAAPGEHFLAIAPRNRLQRGGINQCPSVSQDEECGVLVGLTYDWVIERHHVYVLVVESF